MSGPRPYAEEVAIVAEVAVAAAARGLPLEAAVAEAEGAAALAPAAGEVVAEGGGNTPREGTTSRVSCVLNR